MSHKSIVLYTAILFDCLIIKLLVFSSSDSRSGDTADEYAISMDVQRIAQTGLNSLIDINMDAGFVELLP